MTRPCPTWFMLVTGMMVDTSLAGPPVRANVWIYCKSHDAFRDAMIEKIKISERQ